MRKSKARFIKAGVTKYGNSLVFISPESIKAAHKKIVGKPVYENHDYKTKPVGKVTGAAVEHEWIVGDFTSEKPYKKVSVGYDAARVLNTVGKKYDNIVYDYEMVNIRPFEISGITNNKNRYTGSDVIETRILNSTGEEVENFDGVDSDDFRVYNCVDVDEILNEEEGITMFNKLKQTIEGVTDSSIISVKNAADDTETEMTLGELKALPAENEELKTKVSELTEEIKVKNSAEPQVEVDGEVYKAEDVKTLKEQVDKEVELEVDGKTYNEDEITGIIKEATTSDEEIQNSVDKSKEYDAAAKKVNDKINKTLESLGKK